MNLFGSTEENNSSWLSTSDLMSGLMMVFLLIAVSLMKHAQEQTDDIRTIVVAYQENQEAIYQALMEEFQDDLEEWEASIDRGTLTFTFQSPDTLFTIGKATLKKTYRDRLRHFFPRYINVISQFRDSIDEVRIEGHTSSEWSLPPNPASDYFHNMRLSQDRTRSVLQFVSTLPTVSEHKDWIQKHIAAVGYSSSQLIFTEEGDEDKERSKRVNFRIMTNSDVKIAQIIGKIQ